MWYRDPFFEVFWISWFGWSEQSLVRLIYYGELLLRELSMSFLYFVFCILMNWKRFNGSRVILGANLNFLEFFSHFESIEV